MRLFIAIPFSVEFVSEIKKLQAKLPRADARVVENPHLTLFFLGDVSKNKVEEIKKKLNGISFSPFKLSADKLFVFKNKEKEIKVVWIGIPLSEELKLLYQSVREKMTRLGFSTDKPFKPHITLARVKSANNKEYQKQLERISVPALTEEVGKLILYRSELSSKGPVYDPLMVLSAKGEAKSKLQKTAYLALGSNLGDRKNNLKKALELIEEEGIDIIKKSEIYETKAVSKVKQNDFLNMCIEVKVSFSPQKLLTITRFIERRMGRDQKINKRKGYELPRIIDIDILLYNQQIINSQNLTIPHPEMHRREFVLKPLSDIAPFVKHPVNQNTISELLKNL